MKSEPRLAAQDLPPALSLPVRLALWIVAGLVVAGWLVLVVLHVDDDYRVTHLQGIWIATAEAARHGWLYPPLFDGEHYAGTRWMPLPILINAWAFRVIGDPLIGGKLLAAILMVSLLLLVVMVLRQVSCPWSLAAALAAVVVATESGLQAGTTIGGDLLPVVLQVGALAAALRRRNGPSTLVAGGLAGLAVASKLTGTWALLAIVTWLGAQRKWRAATMFAVAGVGTAVTVLGTIQVLTRGGLSEHLLAFSMAGVQTAYSLLRGPNQVLYNLRGFAVGALVLVPLTVLGAILSTGWRHVSLTHFALGYALLLLLVVYADLGSGFNQLLDVVVLIALAVGHLAGRALTSADPRTGQMVLVTVSVTVVWAAGLDLVRTVGFDVRKTATALRAREPATHPAHVVASMVGPGEEVLAEDPFVSVVLNRRPVVMDPFMFRRLDSAHPQWVDSLIARIADRRFDLVVLLVPLEDRKLDFWWANFHFGPRVADALRASYRPAGTVEDYHLYRPVR